MRGSLLFALALAAAVAGCSRFSRGGQVTDTAPAHAGAQSANIFGDWILGSSPDSTAFVGARVVQMGLSPSRFTIIANYAAGEPWVVTGMVAVSEDGGMIRLTPETNNRTYSGVVNAPLRPNMPFELLVSAADNSMVFAPPPNGALDLGRPSSVWHRRDAAMAAGLVTSVSTGAVADTAKTTTPPRNP